MSTHDAIHGAVGSRITTSARLRLLTTQLLGSCFIAGALAPTVASSAVIVSDGTLHIVTALNDNVRVNNGATVDVRSGGIVNGTGPDGSAPPGFTAAIQADPLSGSRITVSGNGRVQGGTDQLAISQLGIGRIDLNDNARVVSGRDDRVAVLSFGLSEPPNSQQLRTAIGGSAYVDGHVHADGVVSLSGNAVINGDLREANGGTQLLMSGGTITGDVGASSLVGHIGYLTGGSVLGSYGGGNTTNFDFSMRGGSIGGSWSTSAQQLHAEFHDGQVGGGLAFQLASNLTSDSRMSIFGGQIDTLADGWLIDWAQGSYVDGMFTQTDTPIFLDLWGGQLGYGEAGHGIRLTGLANLDVYGVGLALVGDRLTGMLADGSLVDLMLAYDPNWSGQVQLHDVSVPEPGTLALLAVGLLGTGLASRRRKLAAEAG